MPLFNPRKLRKLRNDPKLFFQDAFKKRLIPLGNALKKYKPKKREGYSKYVIVSAVYNVEKYLDDYFKSIINQRLDFKKNIHIVCVDDGSTDNSAKIIKSYQKKYPKNITYLYKENGGQASARNLGLKYLQENESLKDKFTWVTFTDPDDFLDNGCFYEVDEFLEKNNQKEIVSFCLKQTLYFEVNNSFQDHPLLHFKHNQGVLERKIDNLSKEIQSSTCSLFLLEKLLDVICFRDGVQYFEDMAFALEYYLVCPPKSLVVFLPQSIYYIRKRGAADSTMNKSFTDKVYYLDALRLCLEVLNNCRDKASAVFLHAQYSVFSMMIYQIRALVDNSYKVSFLNSQEKKEYLELVQSIFDLIEAEVIESFNACGNNYFYKFSLLNCFKKEELPYKIAYIQDYDASKEQVLIQYYSIGKDHVESIRFDGKEVYADYEKIIQHDFLGRTFCFEKRLWVHVPKEAKKYLEIFVDGQPIMIGWKCYQYDLSKIRQEFKKSEKIDNIWLFIDRDIEADDNAERLYRYVSENYPHQKIFFALMRDCLDWERLEKERFNLVECYTHDFYQIAKKAKFFISSHTPQGYKVKLNVGQKFIFLGHGVDVQDVSNYFNCLGISLRTSSSNMEIFNLTESNLRYFLTKKEVKLTGQARHDSLLLRNKINTKNILIMPTWREYLVYKREVTFDRKLQDIFFESEYFIKWKSFLHSEKLAKLSLEYGYKITFVPHFNMRAILDYIEIPKYIDVGYREGGETFQKYFQESDLMITDYTSAAFEMAYLRKPVLYYQFDEEEFFVNHSYTKGCFDYRTDGFGPVVETEDDLLKELENLLKNDCKVGEPYKSNIENTFAFRDGKCCERIYQEILKLDEPYQNEISLDYVKQKAQDALGHECYLEAMWRFQYLLENSENFDEEIAKNCLKAAMEIEKGYEIAKILLEKDCQEMSRDLKFLIVKNILSNKKDPKEEVERCLEILETMETPQGKEKEFLLSKLRIYFYLANRKRINEIVEELQVKYGVSKEDIHFEMLFTTNAISLWGGGGNYW